MIMPHERRRFRNRVDYVTSPGYGDGPGWRQRMGLPRGGPSALITTLGVFGFDSTTCEAVLLSYHPEIGIERIREETGAGLRVSKDVRPTSEPMAEELAVIRDLDPQRFWTK
jgi:glutaconate CoA-transferase subunit B